jgi:hypothetical protein
MTIEFVKSTEWPQNSLDLNLLDYHAWNENQLAYMNQRTVSVPEVTVTRNENVWPLIS